MEARSRRCDQAVGLLGPVVLSACAVLGDVGSSMLLVHYGSVGIVPALSSGVLSISLALLLLCHLHRRAQSQQTTAGDSAIASDPGTASAISLISLGGALVFAAVAVGTLGFLPIMGILFSGVVVARKGRLTLPLALSAIAALGIATLGFNVALGLNIPLVPGFL